MVVLVLGISFTLLAAVHHCAGVATEMCALPCRPAGVHRRFGLWSHHLHAAILVLADRQEASHDLMAFLGLLVLHHLRHPYHCFGRGWRLEGHHC